MEKPQGWLSDEEYQNIYRQVPMLCVDMVIQNGKGVLLSRRDIEPFKGLWHFPGGRVRYRESVNDAVIRIAQGELGLDITKFPKSHLGFIDAVNDGEFRHSVSIVYGIQERNFDVRADANSSGLKVFSSIPVDMQPYQKEFLENHPEVFNKGGFA